MPVEVKLPGTKSVCNTFVQPLENGLFLLHGKPVRGKTVNKKKRTSVTGYKSEALHTSRARRHQTKATTMRGQVHDMNQGKSALYAQQHSACDIDFSF